MNKLQIFALTLIYLFLGKDPYISDLLLHEIVNRMGKSLDDVGDSFIDPMPVKEMPSRLSLMARATKDLEAEQLDYDTVMNGERSAHPSMRDQEYLEHSSLFGIYYFCIYYILCVFCA